MTGGFAVRRNLLAPLVAFSLVAAPCAFAQTAGSTAERWQFSVTPYLWLPNIDSTLKFSIPPGAGGSPSVEAGANDYLENLDFALMLAGEARRGGWAIFSVVIAAAFIFPEVLDAPAVKAELQRKLSEAVRGEVAWEDLGIRILPSPRAIVRKVRIEVPRSLEVNAEELAVRLALWPLLRGRFEIVSVDLSRPAIRAISSKSRG